MNSKTDLASDPKLDMLKWAVAILLLAVGTVGFYYFAEQVALLIRVVVLLALAGAGAFVVSGTAKGQQALGFLREAYNEVRRVVWPTRQETIQTTAVVIVMVIIVALFIWALDSTLFWIVRWFTGRG